MCGAVEIDVGEFAQTVWCVLRRDQATAEVFQRRPLRVEGICVTDVEVHAGGGAQGVVLGPLGEVDRHRPAVDESVPIRTLLCVDVEVEPAVPVECGVQLSDGDDW